MNEHLPSADPDRTAVREASTDPSATVDATADSTRPKLPPPPTDAPVIPGYRVIQEIAKGGMGKVYEAVDLTLDREVAIKRLLPGANADRFVTESKITARLPHPNIPPVHELGQLADGTPFLVMKLIRGQTLAALLKARPSPAHDLPRFVQVFEQIAQAVGFAHSRGVIHRDLKPLNVMVGEFGEVQVMDWGLARTLASRAGERPESDGTPVAHPPGSPDLTQAGAILGTPGYMAPEQARGEPLDARADVFALGATLAAILTGQPAFVGSTAVETIQKAAAADLSDVLTRLDVCGADADLIAVAKRCLSADRDSRPADGHAVATEVGAYRAGVEARLRQAETERAEAVVREGEQRMRRRQFNLAAGVVVTVLLLGIVGTSMGLIWANKKADDERLAKLDAQKKQEKAEQAEAAERTAKEAATAARGQEREAKETALDALDTLVSEAAGHSLATQAQVTPDQRRFLAQVLPHYRKFSAVGGDDVFARTRLGGAAYQVGMIEGRLGRKGEAASAFRQAHQAFTSLSAEFPDVAEYRRRRVLSQNCLSIVLRDLGRGEEAVRELLASVTVCQDALTERPNDPSLRELLAASRGLLGVVYHSAGKREDAEKEQRAVLALCAQLVADFPDDPRYATSLAHCRHNLSVVLAERGLMDEAEAVMRKALSDLQRADDKAATPTSRAELATSHYQLGQRLADRGKWSDAEAEYRVAATLREKLVAEYPSNPNLRSDLANAYNSLGLLLTDQRKTPGDLYDKALALQQKVVAEVPEQPEFRRLLTAIHSNLGVAASDQRRWAEAEAHHRTAISGREKLVAEYPANPDYRNELATALMNLGAMHVNAGNPKEAEKWTRAALPQLERLATDYPAVIEYQLAFGGTCCNVAHTLRNGGHPADSLEWYDKAARTLTPLVGGKVANPNARLFLRNVHWGRARAFAGLGKHADAMPDWEKALDLSPADAKVEFRTYLATAKVQAGRVTEGVADLQALAKSARMDESDWYDIACVYAIASVKSTDKKVEYADAAVQALQKAVKAGYKDAAHMKEDTDLDPLRERDDFKQLLAELEQKFPPKLEVLPPPRAEK